MPRKARCQKKPAVRKSQMSRKSDARTSQLSVIAGQKEPQHISKQTYKARQPEDKKKTRKKIT
jgi:hypothetical protein